MNAKNKILYVDDEPINVQLFEYNFSKKFEVHTGTSGMEGLDKLEKYPDIKVVISDMRMPNMNGLEFANRANEKFRDKIFFILTGFDITEEIKQAIDNRLIHKYFRKPLNTNMIETAIFEVI